MNKLLMIFSSALFLSTASYAMENWTKEYEVGCNHQMKIKRTPEKILLKYGTVSVIAKSYVFGPELSNIDNLSGCLSVKLSKEAFEAEVAKLKNIKNHQIEKIDVQQIIYD